MREEALRRRPMLEPRRSPELPPLHRTWSLCESRGQDGRDALSPELQSWLQPLWAQLPKRFWIHDDEPAHRAAARLGCAAFTLGDRVYLGRIPSAFRGQVLRHELVHLAQIRLGQQLGRAARNGIVEHEAEQIAAAPSARRVLHAGRPDRCYYVLWVAIGVGLYILLRPGVANAPGPASRLRRSPSLTQITFESFAIFVVPGGALSFGARLGLGFLGTTAMAGASGNVSLRVVEDVFNGAPSPPLLYLFDATTGAVLGYVVPGGIRWIGRAGTARLDSLATFGLVRSDIAITERLAEAAAVQPLNAALAQSIVNSLGLSARVSAWWLNRRGMIVLYRGQGAATSQILSPLARQEGIAASEALLSRMRAASLTDAEIAGYTARWHTQPVPPFAAPAELPWTPLGSVGIPTTRLPGIAANFGEEGVIYVLRVPSASAVAPLGWQGLQLETEHVIFNSVPEGSVVQTIPARRVAPLLVNESGLLIPGR